VTATLCLIDAVDERREVGAAARSRRSQMAQAMARRGATLVALDYRSAFETALPEAHWYKFDAPGQNEALDAWLIQLGAQQLSRPPPRPRAHGEVHARDEWFAGFALILRAISAKARRWVNGAESILAMTDKLQCQRQLAESGAAVPPLLGEVTSFDALRERMRADACERVFVKSRFGSSASGVIALRRSGERWRASAAGVLDAGRLFNTLRIRQYVELRQVAALIDALCATGSVYAERWIAKPRAPDGGCFDLRVVVHCGKPRQRIARCSLGPITNLHLGNRREAPSWLAPSEVAAVERTAVSVAQLLPEASVFGADLIVSARGAMVIEVNAFGDHLHGVTFDGASAFDDQAAWMSARTRG